MIYFRKKDDIIEKYEVQFDADKVKDLKERIINDCSRIKHYDYESSSNPWSEYKIIKNDKSYDTGKAKDSGYSERRIYHWIYDELKPPKLVDFIDSLLIDDVRAIDNIWLYDDFNNLPFEEEIKALNDEIIAINVENVDERMKKVVELKALLHDRELSKNQKNVREYYDELKSLITFTLIDSLLISDVERIESFFNTNVSAIVSEKPVVLNLVDKKISE